MEVDNLQWVNYRINRMKTDMAEQEFLNTCRLVLRYRETV